MRWSTARVSFAAVSLWCACAAAATGQTGTGQAINGPAGHTALFQSDAVGFVGTLRASLVVPGALPPARIVVTAEVRPMLERMWRDSPTFRRQCARLVEASITVVVRLVGPSGELAVAAAISRIDLQDGLVTSADVRLGSVEPRYLAHEIEHVLEQLDGVDLRIGRGAWCARRRDRPSSGTVRDCESDQCWRSAASELGRRPPSQGDRQRKSRTHRGGGFKKAGDRVARLSWPLLFVLSGTSATLFPQHATERQDGPSAGNAGLGIQSCGVRRVSQQRWPLRRVRFHGRAAALGLER